MKLVYNLHPLGDNAVIIQLGEDISSEIQKSIHMITSFLDLHPKEWMIEYIPAFTTIAIYYDPVKISAEPHSCLLPYDIICTELQQILSEIQVTKPVDQRIIEIPVCYGGEFGPDLAFIAAHNRLTPEEVIRIHSNGSYLVHMIGFAPGFPYIGGMSEKIASPRRKTPRLKIPARSVGIGGKQTGIYPLETPGGWQIIGRTPIELFRPGEEIPSLLQPGDRIKFIPINREEYFGMEG